MVVFIELSATAGAGEIVAAVAVAAVAGRRLELPASPLVDVLTDGKELELLPARGGLHTRVHHLYAPETHARP